MGTLSVASPIFDADRKVVAALAVVLRSSPGDLRRLAPAVHCAALSASRAMHERPLAGSRPVPIPR